MSKIKNKLSKIQDGEYSVTSATERYALLRKVEGVWTLMDFHGDTIEEHNVLATYESYKAARSELKSFDLDAALDRAKAEVAVAQQKDDAPAEPSKSKGRELSPEELHLKAVRKSLRVWLGKIAADFMDLESLSEADLAASGIESVRFTKAWVHIVFTGGAGMTEMADSLASLESSDSRTRAAIKRAVKTLRDAAAKALA